MLRRKPFTIERRMRIDGEPELEAPAAGVPQLLTRLDELGALMRPTQAVAADLAEAYRREVLEGAKLRAEMEAIQSAIAETKRHVASLHAAAPRAVTVTHAAGELGAVVADAEGATHAVIDAAERIEMLAGAIQSEPTAEGAQRHASAIAVLIQTVYEACNFQDLAGQRIARVCETLHFVEARIARMAEIWGGLEALSGVMATEIEALHEEKSALGTHGLAAGPALIGADGHVTQKDIDTLFG